jgi:hypothetical protein
MSSINPIHEIKENEIKENYDPEYTKEFYCAFKKDLLGRGKYSCREKSIATGGKKNKIKTTRNKLNRKKIKRNTLKKNIKKRKY